MVETRIGVDLGTCYSSVGYHNGGSMHFLKDPAAPQLSYSIPSSALVDRDGRLVFGALAESEKSVRPDRYRSQFKRDLGSSVPYQLGDLFISPEELTAAFLQFLIDLARETLGSPPEEAVVTVPATYDAHRQSLIEKAMRSAGVPKVHLVPEPVAALVSAVRGGQLPEEGTLLVFDLGGGTFDTSVVRIEGTQQHVLGARGLPDFGGTDIDLLIQQDFAQRAVEQLKPLLAGQFSDDPIERTRALRMEIAARDMCREIKHRLSIAERAYEELGLTISYELTREQLEEMVRPQLNRTIETCRQLLADTETDLSQISGVLLVGGSCRMPAVREIVASQLGRPVWPALEPELAVCEGATLLAHLPIQAPPDMPSRRDANAPLPASERYQQAMASAWADGRLSSTEADRLIHLGTKLLLLESDLRHHIEREVLGETLDRTMERQRAELGGQYEVALRLIHDFDAVAALKAIPPRRLEMLLGNVELFTHRDFPDSGLRADQRAALLGDQSWPAFVEAVRVAVQLDPATPHATRRLRELADDLGLDSKLASAAEEKVLGRSADAFFREVSAADRPARVRGQESIKEAEPQRPHLGLTQAFRFAEAIRWPPSLREPTLQIERFWVNVGQPLVIGQPLATVRTVTGMPQEVPTRLTIPSQHAGVLYKIDTTVSVPLKSTDIVFEISDVAAFAQRAGRTTDGQAHIVFTTGTAPSWIPQFGQFAQVCVELRGHVHTLWWSDSFVLLAPPGDYNLLVWLQVGTSRSYFTSKRFQLAVSQSTALFYVPPTSPGRSAKIL
jgi:actin-like ATPase involved in cell morphogenesis